jgi:biopolymer transport protein ExbD
MQIEESADEAKINITPLVDVCLVLVLIFMVTMPLSVIYGITAKSHSLKRFGISTPRDHVMIHLTGRGPKVKNDKGQEQLVAYEDFGAVLRQLIQLSKSSEVHLRVDRDVPHGQTVWALDLAKQNGASNVGLMENK